MRTFRILVITLIFMATTVGAATPSFFDVVLVIDVTTGMQDELDRLADALLDISGQLKAGEPTPRLRFGGMLFRDRGDREPFRRIPLNDGFAHVASVLGSTLCAGGGDTPEAAWDAVSEAISGSAWQRSSEKTIILITDAAAHTYVDGAGLESVMNIARNMKVKIFPILGGGASPVAVKEYEQLAAASGGQVQHLTYSQPVKDVDGGHWRLLNQNEESGVMPDHEFWQEGLAAVQVSGLDFRVAPKPGSGVSVAGYEMVPNTVWENNVDRVLLNILRHQLTSGQVTFPAPHDQGNDVAILREFQGDQCGFPEAGQRVITSVRDFYFFWQKLNSYLLPSPEMPAIDFETQVVIGVFQGEQRSGGFDINIQVVKDTGIRRYVLYQEKAPSSGLVTMALTQPYHLVVVPKTDLPVVFVKIS